MTTTRSTANCTDCDRKLTSSNRAAGSLNTDLCGFCFDLAGYENEHLDGLHIDEPDMVNCPDCNSTLRDSRKPQTEGHTNGVALSHTSHAGHDHPATKAARAACRKARKA